MNTHNMFLWKKKTKTKQPRNYHEILLLHPSLPEQDVLFLANSVDPDQLAFEEAN